MQQLLVNHRTRIRYYKLQHPVAFRTHLVQFHSSKIPFWYVHIFNKSNRFQLKDEPWLCICWKKLRKQFKKLAQFHSFVWVCACVLGKCRKNNKLNGKKKCSPEKNVIIQCCYFLTALFRILSSIIHVFYLCVFVRFNCVRLHSPLLRQLYSIFGRPFIANRITFGFYCYYDYFAINIGVC